MPSCYARATTKYNHRETEQDNFTSNVSDIALNITAVFNSTDNSTWINDNDSTEKSFLIREFGLIRLTVLGIVIMVLLLSTCRIVFQTFSKSVNTKRDDEY